MAINKNCGIGFSSDRPRLVTKPKLFDEAMHVRLPKGTKARIDALRGTTRQGDFVRKVLLNGLDELEAEKTPSPQATQESS